MLSIIFLIFFAGCYLIILESTGKCRTIGAVLLVLSFASFYQLFEVKIPSIIAQADTRIEEFTDYDEISDQFTDTYDMTVHDLNGAKEIRYYDRATAHDPKFRLLSGGRYTTYYYRVKPDLSYERIPLDETSFDKNRN